MSHISILTEGKTINKPEKNSYKKKWRALTLKNESENELKYCSPLTQLNSTAKDIQRAIRVLQDTILRVHLYQEILWYVHRALNHKRDLYV